VASTPRTHSLPQTPLLPSPTPLVMTNESPQAKITAPIDANLVQKLFSQQHEMITHFFQNINYEDCTEVMNHIIHCDGMVLISGVGKSGSIAMVFSDFLVSMGIRSRFLSPVNALHGDIGIVCEKDVFIFISKSGETEELKLIMPFIKNRRAFTISLVCNKNSSLAKASDLGIELPLLRELCPYGMAPVTSSILQMIFGATISIACMNKTGLSLDMYARNHPGGAIGRSLCLQAKDVMLTEFPKCGGKTLLKKAFVNMSVCGAVVVLDEETNKLLGMFTDGDLRRCLKNKPENDDELTPRPDASYDSLMKTPLSELVKKSPFTVKKEEMAKTVLGTMQANKIHQMVVVDFNGDVAGLILERDLIRLGL
jgi:arabinose-5-phosphate isomerase